MVQFLGIVLKKKSSFANLDFAGGVLIGDLAPDRNLLAISAGMTGTWGCGSPRLRGRRRKGAGAGGSKASKFWA